MRNTKRPGVIIGVSALGFARRSISFLYVFSPAIKKLGVFVPAIYGVIICSYFISYIGLWHMKRWGAELYMASFFANLIFIIYHNAWGLVNIISIPVAITNIILIGIYYRRLDINL